MDGFSFWSGFSAAWGESGFNMQHRAGGHQCSTGDWKWTGHPSIRPSNHIRLFHGAAFFAYLKVLPGLMGFVRLPARPTLWPLEKRMCPHQKNDASNRTQPHLTPAAAAALGFSPSGAAGVIFSLVNENWRIFTLTRDDNDSSPNNFTFFFNVQCSPQGNVWWVFFQLQVQVLFCARCDVSLQFWRD